MKNIFKKKLNKGGNMKYLLSIIFTFALLFFNGCSNDAAPTSSGGGGLGGGGTGGTGGVTITVSVVQDDQGQQHFLFKPSTSVVVNQVRLQCTAQQVDETVQGDGQTVYTTTDGFSVGPLNQGILQTGQQWNFTITGKVGSATGTAFTATPIYTVP